MKDFEQIQIESRADTRQKRIDETVRLAQRSLRANHPEARALNQQNPSN